jgi:ATP-binding cassette subfamily B protein
LPPCVDFVGAVVVLCTIDVRMALTLIGFVAVVAGFMFAFGRRARPLQQAFAERAAQVGGELVDVVANIFTVMAFSAREREHRRLREAFGLEASAQRRSWLYLEKARAFHDLCLWLMAGAMLIWAVEAWRAGLNEAGDVVLISALTFRILHGSRELALSMVDASQHFGVIAEMLRVVAVPHEVADRPDAQPFVPGPGTIAFHEVHFAYDDGRPVFEHLNLLIPAGPAAGRGRSLGRGQVDPGAAHRPGDGPRARHGHGRRRGRGARAAGQPARRHRRGAAGHHAAASLDPGKPALRQSWRKRRAGARSRAGGAVPRLHHEAAAGLRHGGRRARRAPSGGQRQRISIARAMLKNAPVLLLDEATSALDSRSEAEIQAALARLMLGRTVVAVAHRLSTVAAFDRIIVLADGRIVEDGPPGVLIARDGVYASLWRMQAQGQETP